MAAREPKRIRISPDGELALLIKDALSAGEPILIDTGETVFSIGTITTKVSRRPSPEEVARSREGILKAAGSWKDVDAEAFKAYVYKRRRASRRRTVRL